MNDEYPMEWPASACQSVDELRETLEAKDRRIAELEGDIQILKLQRDATHVSRCPRCADNERLRAVLQQVMARLADLLESDQFNNIEALVLNAGVDYPELAAVEEKNDE